MKSLYSCGIFFWQVLKISLASKKNLKFDILLFCFQHVFPNSSVGSREYCGRFVVFFIESETSLPQFSFFWFLRKRRGKFKLQSKNFSQFRFKRRSSCKRKTIWLRVVYQKTFVVINFTRNFLLKLLSKVENIFGRNSLHRETYEQHF